MPSKSTGQIETKMIGKNAPVTGTLPSIVLEDPKFARNVSQIVRIASGYRFRQIFFTGHRVDLEDPSKNIDGHSGKRGGKKGKGKARLPREERMKGYKNVDICHHQRPFDCFEHSVPVIGIELRKGAMPLHEFEHPKEAIYVFGPEDGSVTRLARHCHQFVYIPVCNCLNLSTAVSTVLWDRQLQLLASGDIPTESMDELLRGDRASLRMKDFEAMDMLSDKGSRP